MRRSRSIHGRRRQRRLVVTAARAVVIQCVCMTSGCKMPELTRMTPQQFPQPQSCAHCHVEIYSEWAHSPHAMAFASAEYRRATNDYQFAQCIGCHAPEPQRTDFEPLTRSTDRDDGVVCAACHLKDGAMVGPLEPSGFAKPHPVRVDPAMFDNGVLCGRCHQSTLTQWQSATMPDKKDCRDCHMPMVQRTMTQATSLISRPIVAAEKPTFEHRHTFSMSLDEMPYAPVSLDAAIIDANAVITLRNLLPHNLPTGDFGVRIVEVVAQAIDDREQGTVIGRWELTGTAKGSLPAGAARRWVAAVPPDATRIHVEVARFTHGGGERTVLLEREVARP
jgi:Cytochrome c554 and c-prime